MSKGRNPTKKKWRNGQRQKGSHIAYLSLPPTWKPKRTWYYYKHGHMGKKRNKFPRAGKFLKGFEGGRLSMRRPYFYISIQLNPCLVNMTTTGRASKYKP